MSGFGRMYTVVMDADAVTAAQDLIRVSAPATSIVLVQGWSVTQENITTSDQVAVQLQRSSTDGTGTANTPEPTSDGHTAFGGTAVDDLSADTSIAGVPLFRRGFNLLNGLEVLLPPEAWVVVAPSTRIVLRLDVAPAASTTMSAELYIMEIGT